MRLNNLSSNDIVYKDLQGSTRDLFRDVHGWSCREQVIKGYEPLFSIDCVALAKHGIMVSAVGFEEKQVLDKVPILKRMVSSVIRKNSLRKDIQGDKTTP